MFLRILILLLLSPAIAQGEGLPLFQSDDTLEIVLEFPMKTILRRPENRPVVDGSIEYTDESGNTVNLPVTISTRGKSRLEVCKFPPLSLSFKKKLVKGSIFEGQKSLKLVTHCQSSRSFRSYVRQEYAIYEAFTVLTDVSFRARYLDITYRDSEKAGYEIKERGFLIESIGEIATRTGLERQKVAKIHTVQLDSAHTALATMFQFMIGNTDWSVKLGSGGANCCHNGRALSPPGSDSGWMVVPYDFDQAGIINTNYAEPGAQLGIRSVRQRLWRGRCVLNDQVDDVIAVFNEHREELETVLLPDGILDPKSVTRYIEDFYKIINDPKQRTKYIEKHCMAG